jgi:methyl-accepting chemotaxis protein
MINFRKLKIGTRLAIGFGIICVLMLIIGAIAFHQLSEIRINTDDEMSEADKMFKINEVRIIIDDIYFNMYGLVTADNMNSKKEYYNAVAGKRSEYKKRLEELQIRAKTKTGRELLGNLNKQVVEAREVNNRIIEAAMKTDGLDTVAMKMFNGEAIKYNTDKIHPAINEIVAWREKRIKEADELSASSFSKSRFALEVGSLMALALAIFLSFSITRSIVAPINRCLDFTQLLSKCDFSNTVAGKDLASKDEMGDLARAHDTMVHSIRELLKTIIGNVDATTSSVFNFLAANTQSS